MPNSPNITTLHLQRRDTVLSVQPLVTIVIPTYNRGLFIRDAITSVIAQTYANWELIVVDDGSADDTVNLIRSIPDQRIRLLELKHCGNIARLRNAGAEAGSGEWIAFLDSDDMWVPQKIENQLCQLQKEKTLWGYGGFEMIDEKGSTVPNKSGGFYPFSGRIIKQLITSEAAVAIGSLIISRRLFNKTGGFNTDPKLFCREDYELALRLALIADVSAMPEAIVKIREHKNRTTNTLDNGPEYTAFVYQHFLNNLCEDKELKKITQRQYVYHLTDASVKSTQKKKYLRAINLFGKAVMNGAKPWLLLSSLKQNFYWLFKNIKRKD